MKAPGANEPVRWLLEYTFDGDEYGNAVYTDEVGCRHVAATEGGTCVALVRAGEGQAVDALRELVAIEDLHASVSPPNFEPDAVRKYQTLAECDRRKPLAWAAARAVVAALPPPQTGDSK